MDCDDPGSVRPKIMSDRNWRERDACGKPHALFLLSLQFVAGKPSPAHASSPKPAMVAAGGVRGPDAGSRRLHSLWVRAGSRARSGTRRPACIPRRTRGTRDRPDRSAHQGRIAEAACRRGGRQADLARDERDGMAVPNGAAKGEGMGKGMAQDSLTGRPRASRSQVETLEAERCSGIKVLERPLCVRSNARRSRGQAESKGAGFLPPLARICGSAVAAVTGKTRAASRPSGE